MNAFHILFGNLNFLSKLKSKRYHTKKSVWIFYTKQNMEIKEADIFVRDCKWCVAWEYDILILRCVHTHFSSSVYNGKWRKFLIRLIVTANTVHTKYKISTTTRNRQTIFFLFLLPTIFSSKINDCGPMEKGHNCDFVIFLITFWRIFESSKWETDFKVLNCTNVVSGPFFKLFNR